MVPLGVLLTSSSIINRTLPDQQFLRDTFCPQNFPKCRPKERCLPAEWMGKFGVMLSGIVNRPAEDEAITVNHDIAFDTLDLLIGIETVVAVTVAPFDTFGIQCSDRRAFARLAFPSDSHDCLFYEIFDMTVLSPLTEKLIDRLAFIRKISWKHSPLAADDQKIENCLKKAL